MTMISLTSERAKQLSNAFAIYFSALYKGIITEMFIVYIYTLHRCLQVLSNNQLALSYFLAAQSSISTLLAPLDLTGFYCTTPSPFQGYLIVLIQRSGF